ncbi:MAG: chorismate-binding protein [Rhodoluna sp.]
MQAKNLNLDKASFLKIAGIGNVIPLSLKIFGGNETPVGLFDKVAKERSGTFLLESAEQGVWSRYSFIGVNSRTNYLSTGHGFTSTDKGKLLPDDQLLSEDPLETLRQMQDSWHHINLEDMPPLTSGLVGLFCWDLIHQLEKIPVKENKPYLIPLIQLEMVQDIIVIDHKDSGLQLISNIYCDEATSFEAAYQEAVSRLDLLFELVSQPTNAVFKQAEANASTAAVSNTTEDDFISAVNVAKEHVKVGDVFQVVLSQRFDVELNSKPIDVYRVLRALNPSPYMYLLNFEDEGGKYSIVGSSPEALVKVSSGEVVMHPIAGSRPRGASQREDQEFAESLIEDQKERAEHLMLVDLARNDLLKVSEPESIRVSEFMKIERFSHIMHLVSTVESKLTYESGPVDLLAATFPAGTLSGAPKPRALQIIADLEQSNRGLFGGVVGYLDFSGNADLAIAIRTAVLRNGKAHVQAGAGIVLDSDPKSEYTETVNKASALIAAIRQANAMFG